MKIQDLRAREIIDCKGKPLLEVDIITEDGTMGRAASPSGISAGEHEAMVLRDGDRSRYDGNGVRKAVEMAEKVVLPGHPGAWTCWTSRRWTAVSWSWTAPPISPVWGAMSRTARRWRSCGRMPAAPCVPVPLSEPR